MSDKLVKDLPTGRDIRFTDEWQAMARKSISDRRIRMAQRELDKAKAKAEAFRRENECD